MSERLTVLSVFSGAGGLDVGLEGAGFESVGALEIDATARRTLALNRPNWPLLGDGDVNSASTWLSPARLGLQPGELSLIAGGPPCQPFSMAAQWSATARQGMQDLRAQTLHGTLRLVESFLPRAVMLENVQGFVSGSNSAMPTLENFVLELRRRGSGNYRIVHQLLNAADFGVPQNRKRVVLLLLREDVLWDWPEPSHSSRKVTSWDALHDLPEPIEPPRPAGSWTELLPLIPEGWNYQWLTSKGGGPELFGYRTKYWNFLLKLDKSRPSWTLPASPGPSTGPFHWDNRPLTIAELKRLQSFPDDWDFVGSHRAQVKQLGNATPPLLAQEIGLALAARMGNAGPAILKPRDFSVVDPQPSRHVDSIPKHLIPSVGSKMPHAGAGRGPSPRPKS